MKPALFTSLAPNNLQQQIGCLQSWRPHVSRIVSVNHQAEAQALGDLPAWITPYNYLESVTDGRLHAPLLRIAEAIDALLQPSDPVVLSNSDISLQAPPQSLQSYLLEDGLSFMSRIDEHDNPQSSKTYDEGFDLFFFQARHHHLLPRLPFRMGMPWWDFFLPINFLRMGYPVCRLVPGPARHQAHQKNWDQEAFHGNALAFLEVLFPQLEITHFDHHQALHLCGMVQRLLVSGQPGQPLNSGDLQRLQQKLAGWGNKLARSSQAQSATTTQLIPRLQEIKASLGRLVRRDWQYRFRLENGHTATVSIRRAACRSSSPSVFLFGIHRGGSTLLNWLCSDMLACQRRRALNVPEQLYRQGHYFHHVTQDLDGLYEQNGFCFSGFRLLPQFLQGSENLIRSRKLLLLRDPRDILVSMYFSWAHSHVLPRGQENQANWQRLRQQYQRQSIDAFALANAESIKARLSDYLLLLQNTDNVCLLRYEDIIFDKPLLLDALEDLLQMRLSKLQRNKLLLKYDIRPKAEDIHQHIRQVTPGDHRQKLSATSIDQLNHVFAPLLTTLGYSEPGLVAAPVQFAPARPVSGNLNRA